MHTRFIVLAGTLALGLGAVPAFAHHGWGGQQTEKTEISGTLRKDVSLAGPHATMQITDDKGQVWDVTLAPPPRTERAGLTPGVIPVGAKVRIVGNRNSDPKKFEIKTVRVTWDGKNFDVYPDRL
ncbi:MAG TPA: DUF6152 family protein [Gammaproteobacteria bacterium]|nr:DUF6152 family protein [Gammaproteobacteria bacterium]